MYACKSGVCPTHTLHRPQVRLSPRKPSPPPRPPQPLPSRTSTCMQGNTLAELLGHTAIIYTVAVLAEKNLIASGTGGGRGGREERW